MAGRRGGTLTAKQRLFAAAFVACGCCATKAAIRAGVPAGTAARAGSDWLNLPKYAHVRQAVDAALEQALAENQGLLATALAELLRVGCSRPLEVAERINSNLAANRPLTEGLSEAELAGIAGVSISRFQDEGLSVNVKGKPAVNALQTLLKYYGARPQKPEDDEQAAAAVDQWLDDVERRLSAPLDAAPLDDLADPEPEEEDPDHDDEDC